MSFVTRYWKQFSDESKPELLVQEDVDSKTLDDPYLRPRDFEAPSRRHVLWFGTGQFKAPEAGRRAGSYLDLRYFIPVLAVVCAILVIPLTVPDTTEYGLAYDPHYGTEIYDCASASITPDGTMFGDLGINLVAFDKLSFTAAKAIDLAWNVLAGRLSQFLAAYICYRVSTGVLYLTAEQQRIPAEAFAALALSPTSIWSCVPVFKSISLPKMRILNKLALVWVLVSVTYLLFVVTFVDLMTGYQAGQATWLKQPDGKMVNTNVGPEAILKALPATSPPQNVTMPNGSTVTLKWFGDTRDTKVPQAPLPLVPGSNRSTIFFQSCVDYDTMGVYYLNVTYINPAYNYWAPITTVENGTRQLFAPKLINSYEDEACNTLSMLLTLDDVHLWYTMNATFWADPDNFLCVPADYYRWGFSYRYTVLLTSINSVWLLITAALWLYVELFSQLLQKRGRLDKWRAILDIASALQQRFGHNTGAYTENELDKEVEKLTPLRYSTVAYEGSNDERVVLEECGKGDSWRKGKLRLRWKFKYW